MAKDDEYEVVAGSTEQVEVFIDLQKMLIKLYNMWPDDIAIGVFAAAAGNVCAMIETQYKLHVEDCMNCQDEQRPPTIDMVSVARSNFDYYYNRDRTVEARQDPSHRYGSQVL